MRLVSIHTLRPVAATFLTLVLAGALTGVSAGGVSAQSASTEVEDLLSQLENADPVAAQRLEREIALKWSNSGSAAMDLLLKRGENALDRGDLALATQHLGALIDHAPDFPEAYHRRALVWLRQEQHGLALADLEQVLRLNPNHFEAVFGLGVLLEQLDKQELAYRAYALVLRIHPHYDNAAEAMARLEPMVQGRAL